MPINRHLRERATQLYTKALRSGALIRADHCSLCGLGPVHGHHPDYARPLYVVWLCQPCHARQHVIERAVMVQGLVNDGIRKASAQYMEEHWREESYIWTEDT